MSPLASATVEAVVATPGENPAAGALDLAREWEEALAALRDVNEGVRRKDEAARFEAEAALRAGRALTAIKDVTQHGQWLDALEARGVSQPTAWRCMEFAAMPESAREDGLARHRFSWRKVVEEWVSKRPKRNSSPPKTSKPEKVGIGVAEQDDRLAAIVRIRETAIRTVEDAFDQRLAEASDDGERADLEIGRDAALKLLDQHLGTELGTRLLTDAGV